MSEKGAGCSPHTRPMPTITRPVMYHHHSIHVIHASRSRSNMCVPHHHTALVLWKSEPFALTHFIESLSQKTFPRWTDPNLSVHLIETPTTLQVKQDVYPEFHGLKPCRKNLVSTDVTLPQKKQKNKKHLLRLQTSSLDEASKTKLDKRAYCTVNNPESELWARKNKTSRLTNLTAS